METIKRKNLNNGLAHKSMAEGFTLMEVVLVIGLLTIVASLGLFVSIGNYNTSSFHNEKDLLISALMHARAQAVNNVCIGTTSTPCTDGKAHGVYVERENQLDGASAIKQYVIFQGTAYNSMDPTNEAIKTNYFVKDIGATEVYFEELSGNVATPITIMLRDNASGSSDINIGLEGQITWTN